MFLHDTMSWNHSVSVRAGTNMTTVAPFTHASSALAIHSAMTRPYGGLQNTFEVPQSLGQAVALLGEVPGALVIRRRRARVEVEVELGVERIEGVLRRGPVIRDGGEDVGARCARSAPL
jgi:hypothetical protein